VHILSPSATVRRIVNMTALAVAGVRPAPVLGDLARQVVGVVVQEGHAAGLGRLHAFPQRGMGHHVEIDRHAGCRDALQQADVGGPAGLRQHRVLGTEVLGEPGFEPVLGAADLQEHRGHQRLPALTLQAIDLGAHQRLVIRNA
jgi:hypothetical protein